MVSILCGPQYVNTKGHIIFLHINSKRLQIAHVEVTKQFSMEIKALGPWYVSKYQIITVMRYKPTRSTRQFLVNAPTIAFVPWWHHQMETFSALLVFCVRNSPVIGEFPTQMTVTRSFDIVFDLHLNEQLS